MKNAPKPRELFVTEISYDAEEEDLRKLFTLFGSVSSIHMVKDNKSGKFKGAAFVRMGSPVQAKDACNALDGTYLIDRCISVTLAKPQKPTVPSKRTPANKARPRPAKK